MLGVPLPLYLQPVHDELPGFGQADLGPQRLRTIHLLLARKHLFEGDFVG